MFRVSRVAEADPRLTDQQRADVIAELSPSPDDAISVASPFARALARTKLNQTVGRGFVENIDLADCIFVLLDQERALSAYRREVKALTRGVASGAVSVISTAGTGVPFNPDLGSAAEAEGHLPADAPHSPAPATGVVVDASMVAQLRGETLAPTPGDVNTGMAAQS